MSLLHRTLSVNAMWPRKLELPRKETPKCCPFAPEAHSWLLETKTTISSPLDGQGLWWSHRGCWYLPQSLEMLAWGQGPFGLQVNHNRQSSDRMGYSCHTLLHLVSQTHRLTARSHSIADSLPSVSSSHLDALVSKTFPQGVNVFTSLLVRNGRYSR